MQLKDCTKCIEDMSDEELLERLRTVRHNREIARPAAKARVERAAKKETRQRDSKLVKSIKGMSKEEIELLIKLSINAGK